MKQKQLLVLIATMFVAVSVFAAITTNDLTSGTAEGVPAYTDRSFTMTKVIDLSEDVVAAATGIVEAIIIPSNTWVESVWCHGSGSAVWSGSTTSWTYTAGTFDIGDGADRSYYASNVDLSNVTWTVNEETISYKPTHETTSTFTRAKSKFYTADDTIDLLFDHSISNGVLTLKVSGRYVGAK